MKRPLKPTPGRGLPMYDANGNAIGGSMWLLMPELKDEPTLFKRMQYDGFLVKKEEKDKD
ncbi:MAG: hypothetical protein IGR93_04955 [Hydrococcus sp. C42_A2020_068]|nr:hypothetical protein [Hydrococcus sp. C42_A2020_068]